MKCRRMWAVCSVWLAFAMTACSLPVLDSSAATATPEVLAQWAATAEASSQYGLPDWSAARATGSPEVDACADDPRAWASLRGRGVEWLTLTYPESVYAVEVQIHQSFGRGAISRITLFDSSDEPHVVWEGNDERDPCPGVLIVRMPQTAYATRRVRVDLDESRTEQWNQIDAVELVGVLAP